MKYLIFFLMANTTSAGIARDLSIDGSRVEAIHLCLGRSTVLRFKEKPFKIVAGNNNYFNFEFISNDVTIQPLRSVSTNLFVYGKYNQFVFNLIFTGKQCDDLVRVSGNNTHRPSSKFDFTLANAIKISLWTPARMAIGHNIWMVQISVFNLGHQRALTKDIKIRLNRTLWHSVWEKDVINQGETTRGRIIFKGEANRLLAPRFEFMGSKHQVTIKDQL